MKIVFVNIKLDQEKQKIILSRLQGKADVYFKGNLSRDEFERIIPNVDILLESSPKAEMLQKMRSLEFIQSAHAGIDNWPFDQTPENVILCSNAGSNYVSVAEHAFALILTLAKNLILHQRNMSKGSFDQSKSSILLEGKVLGILGLGTIGKQIARLGQAFGMRVFAINSSGISDFPTEFIGTLGDISQLMKNSDVLVISIPLNKYTKGIIDGERLKLMKEDAILVNVARAPIIEKSDLETHLKANPNFRVALDVWWNPWKFKDDKNMLKHPNLLGTPWIAGASGSQIVWERMILSAVDNVIRFLDGDAVLNMVRKEDYA